MSNRAYRIDDIKLKNNGEETMNLTHLDIELVKLLDSRGFLNQLNEDSVGIAYMDLELAREIVQKSIEFKLPDWTKKAIEEDIKWAEENQKSEIGYYCT